MMTNLYRASVNQMKLLMEPARQGHEEMNDEGNDGGVALSPLMAMEAATAGLANLKSYYRKKLLWYPLAKQVPRIASQGKHVNNYTRGLVVHFNAGRSNPYSTMDSGRNNRYLYDAMGPDGTILQSNPLNEWGYHVGKSIWLGKSGVSAQCRGIEISSAGSLKKVGNEFRPWYYKSAKDAIPADQVRTVNKTANITVAGPYMKYTSAQEAALVQYCLWLKVNNPDVFDFDWVVGHDETAVPRGRKNDPGGALSMTMPEFRAHLKREYAKLMA